MKNNSNKKNSLKYVLFGSLIGTAIEYFDFYIYANAVVLVFPHLFFPSANSANSAIESLATFSLAYLSRPIGSAVFGHYGDKIGRKATLVVALLTMGVSTAAIGFLPGYASIGAAAPILLMICRFGQGVGLGGEWGGATLLAVENAPPNKRALYGMFPQLGAPLGFMLSAGIFFYLTNTMSNEDFIGYGWRIPFIASSVLVIIGLYIRLKISETPAFENSKLEQKEVKIPLFTLLKLYKKELFFGSLFPIANMVTYYLVAVFAMSWATSHLGFTKKNIVSIQLISVLFYVGSVVVSALVGNKFGHRKFLIIAGAGVIVFGFFFPYFLDSGDSDLLTIFTCIGMALVGLTYGLIGTFLSELFPTAIRYSGTSLTFNIAGIFGAAFAPMIATWLSTDYGLNYVGFYLSIVGLISLISVLAASKKEHKF